MGVEAATVFLARKQFHYTPKHASWLNMARSRSAFWTASAPGAGSATRCVCAPKCSLGSKSAIKRVVELTGSLRARTPIKNYRAIM